MPERYSDRALILILLLLMASALTFADAALLRETRGHVLSQNSVLVQRLGLTDLCLFTEARYTRHLSQADLHSAFQDHPFALEHFPTGSIVTPPAALMHYLESAHDGAEPPLPSAQPPIRGKP